MRKINKLDVLRLVLVLALVAGIGLAFGAVGRFVPTHKIVQPVYCGSCHPEQIAELSQTTHIGKFADELEGILSGDKTKGMTVSDEALTNARLTSGGCTMCHNYWENMKWFGVANFAITQDDPDMSIPEPTDIYGNAVSSYGLGSTHTYVASWTYNGKTTSATAVPWTRGLDEYQYTDSVTGTNYSRIDFVWSSLSALSPGPVGFWRINTSNPNLATNKGTCGGGTVEHGMCHIAASAVALSFEEKKREVGQGVGETNSSSGKIGNKGNGLFFTHEMAFTTAQYAAKPVKICGACHIMKLPPMQWGGEPWFSSDIAAVQNNQTGINDDPFGFRPTYNSLIGVAGAQKMLVEGRPSMSLPVAFRTPDWAHSNVPCVRCHAHAGINGVTVTENEGNFTDPRTGLVIGN